MRKALLVGCALAVLFTASPAWSLAQVAAPLSLDGAIAIALRANLEYQRAQAHVDGVVAQLRQARAPQAPGLAFQDTYQYVNPIAKLSTPFGSIPFSTVNATNVPLLALQYTLFDGGLTAARVGQAAAGLAAAQAGQREARGAVIAQVSGAYYDLVAATQMKDVADRAVSVAQAHVTQAQQLLASGMIPRADLLRAQAELANEQVSQISAANGVSLAQAALDNALNVPLSTLYAPTESLGGAVPAFNLDQLVASAHASRGELAAAHFALDAARRAVESARAGYAPQIKATVADGNTQPAVVGGYHNQFSVGLTAVWTLFDNGYSAGAVAQAEAGVHDAQLGFQELENGIDLEVRQAYLNVNEASARVTAAQRLVTLSEENLRLAQLRYRGGVGTALELQDAELRDRAARQTLTSAQAAVRQSVVRLRFAAGLL